MKLGKPPIKKLIEKNECCRHAAAWHSVLCYYAQCLAATELKPENDVCLIKYVVVLSTD